MKKTTWGKSCNIGVLFVITLTSSVWAATVATPAFNPNGGTYNTEQTVTITCATPGVEIHYTWSNDPNVIPDPQLSDPFIENGGSIVVSVDPPTYLKARAWKTGFETSEVKAAVYSLSLIIYVKQLATGANNGTSWEDAYTNLQSALSMAQDDDEIWVAEGTYIPSIIVVSNVNEGKAFQLKNGVTLYGGFAGNETSLQQRDWSAHQTILSGNNSCWHVFYHPSSLSLDNTAVLDGFIIKDGKANNMFSPHCYGGGMYNNNCNPVIRNCGFSNNRADLHFDEWYNMGKGGGIMNDNNSNPLLINCVFTGNTAVYGGGMANVNSSPVMINCIFRENSTVYWDYSGWGGGIYNKNSNPLLINCVLNHNYAREGGGICNEDSDSVITNCIIWGNDSSRDNADQIYIFYGNLPDVTYSDIEGGYSGTGNIDANPLFVDELNGILNLQDSSPCIDAGNNNAVPADITTDLAGSPRFVDDPDKADTGIGTPPIVDMGAYEGAAISPVFTPDGGPYNTEQNVVITCDTSGAEIHYTISHDLDSNPPEPQISDPVIENGGSINISVEPLTILKARAFKTGCISPYVKTAMYFYGTGGSGTAEDPYQINSRAAFLFFLTDTAQYSKYFLLTEDIDLNGQVFTKAVISPCISSDSSLFGFIGTIFTGTLDGNGHKITNFMINGGNSENLGLFGRIGSGGKIKNLGIENFSVSGTANFIGGLAGVNYYGSISNCYAIGTVNGLLQVGGLTGLNYYGSIGNCYVTVTVNGSEDVGGLAGNNYHGSVSNCYSNGAVSGYFYVGGLIGIEYSATATGSFWDTQTSGQTTSAGGTGKTTSQMKTLSTFTSAGWNFSTIWDICETTNYPRLQWQIPETDWVCPDGVNLEDLDYFVDQWLENDCASSNNYCDGVDIDTSGKVDLADFANFAQSWLDGI